MSNVIQLRNTRDVGAQHGIKALVYGPAGVGKTSLVATAPQPVLFSAESGLLALRKYDIPVWEVNSMQALVEAYNWARSSQEARQFSTLCLDSLSEIGEVCLSNAKASVKDPRQAYGELIEQMSSIIRGFRDLAGFHVYMSAKMEYFKDEHSGSAKYIPSMPGSKLGPSLPYLFDEVFYMGVGEDKERNQFRYLQTFPTFQYDAKDRSGSLAQYEPPDLTHVFNKILGVS